MSKRTSLLLGLFMTSVMTTAVIPSTAQTTAQYVPPNKVPSDIPEWHRQKWYQFPKVPKGWTHAVPTGGAITTSGSSGRVEVSSFKLMCNVPGQGRRTIISDVQSIGAGLYLRNPFFGNNDYSEAVNMSRTSDGTVVMNVPSNRVLHWWTNTRGKVPAGANQCSTEIVVRGSGNVIGYGGGNWWKTATAQWGGFNVNNREIGNGDWYHFGNGGWQVVRMDP